MELDEIEEMAEVALTATRLRDRGWTFRWDRAVKRAGCCHYSTRTITLSRPIFTIEANRDEAVETLLHEVAHALAGPGSGHGPLWREYAELFEISTERGHLLVLPDLPVVGRCECDDVHGRVRMPGRGVRHWCRTCRAEVTWTRRPAA